MNEILRYLSSVVRYGYRTGQVREYLFCVPRSVVVEFEKALCSATQSHPDNHTAFSFSYNAHGFSGFRSYNCDLPITSVMFTDGFAIFGNGIEVGNW